MRTCLVLNVAEKPSVAKEIAKHLSTSRSQFVQSHSKYNPVYRFPCQLNGRPCEMNVTSVRGHIMELEFAVQYRGWSNVNPGDLFQAPVQKYIKKDCVDIEKNLKEYGQKSTVLVLWLDCDREGENIAYEVIDVCQKANPSIEIYRARFSALTRTDICRAWDSLALPNPALSQAVQCRQELDLRIGAALTRFLTLRYQNRWSLPAKVVSFGPCQFPTLGFVVERYIQHTSFQSEPYWSLKLKIQTRESQWVDFSWERGNLFDLHVVQTFEEICKGSGAAQVKEVQGKPVTKRKPLPLTTTAMAIMASKKLRVTSKACMEAAESLYQKGIISYPRTETNKFSPTMDLKQLIALQHPNPDWGQYAFGLTNSGKFKPPAEGRSDDQAHPPIHPVKSCQRSDFTGRDLEWRLYDLITRHFLACCSDDAHGSQTVVKVGLGVERFIASGLVVLERNFLDIYPFEQWTGVHLPEFRTSETFQCPRIELTEGRTSAPALLTEADLIKLMDRHGIGTDATMQEHIQTIQDRCYAKVANNPGRFTPTSLGLGLVQGFHGYAKDWLDLSKPHLRASMERDMGLIASGLKLKDQVLQETLNQMKRIYNVLTSDPSKLDSALSRYMGAASNTRQPADAAAPDRGTAGHSQMQPPRTPQAHMLTRVLSNFTTKCRCGGAMSIRAESDGRNQTRRPGNVRPDEEDNRIDRYLLCENYSTGGCLTGPLPLPKRGVIQPHTSRCPATNCGYQVLKVSNSRGSGFHYVCPYCFSMAPSTQFGRAAQNEADIENSAGNFARRQLRCFLCSHPRCGLAGGR